MIIIYKNLNNIEKAKDKSKKKNDNKKKWLRLR